MIFHNYGEISEPHSSLLRGINDFPFKNLTCTSINSLCNIQWVEGHKINPLVYPISRGVIQGIPLGVPPEGVINMAKIKMAASTIGSKVAADEDSPWVYLSKPHFFDKARVRELYGGGKELL